LCREIGQTISLLAAEANSPLKGFGLFAVIKETGVDDEGLLEFYEKYYSYPTYRDEDWSFYTALGNKKLYSVPLSSWNPFKLWNKMSALGERMKSKNVEGNMIGEGITLGGIVLFDKQGIAKFSYVEETGDDVPLEDLIAAVRAVQEGRDE